MSYEDALVAIQAIYGDAAARVARALLEAGDREMRDEEIARELGMKVNEVRKALYTLHAAQVATYRKLFDPESRWYIYLWKIKPEALRRLLIRRLKKMLKVLKERLEYERSNTFFRCKNSDDCPLITFEEALENSFRCPRCGGELEQFDNSKIIKTLEKYISRLEREIEELEAWRSR